MATAGSNVLATDYNGAQSTIAQVMGTATQANGLGYGQALTSSQLAAGTKVQATHWQNLYTDIARALTHQTGTAPTSAVLPAVTAGSKILASNATLYATAATTAYNNRLTAAAANLTTVAATAGSTITRATSWGQGSGGIALQMNATWSSEAAAAAFFNSGGYIYFNLAHPSTATTQDSAWNSFLSGLGTFVFSGTGSAKTGTPGTMTNVPYMSAVSAGTQVLNASMTTANYTANSVKMTYYKVANGIALIVTLTDNHTNAYYDAVQSGTNAKFGYVKANDTGNLPAALSSPTFTIITNW